MTKRENDSILAQLDVETVSADLKLAPRFAAAVLWVSGTAWSVEPQKKCFSLTEIMTSCLRSCFTFYFLSKIQHQHSSVSSQLWEWPRNAGQEETWCRRQTISSKEVCVSTFSWTLSALLRLWSDLYEQRSNLQRPRQKFRQYPGLFVNILASSTSSAWCNILKDFDNEPMLVAVWRLKDRNNFRVLNTDQIPAAFSQHGWNQQLPSPSSATFLHAVRKANQQDPIC